VAKKMDEHAKQCIEIPVIPRIRGWFSSHDSLVFHWFLTSPNLDSRASGILEIGTFEGKSAAFLSNYVTPGERFVVCDIFSLKSDELNDLENSRSYPNFGLDNFMINMDRYARETPEVIVSDSARLQASELGINFRFIHLDGSHLFDHISKDLDLAIQMIDSENGVVAIDDFRAAHTPGVSAAIWKQIVNEKLTPVVLTGTKMYCMKNAKGFRKTEFIDFLVQNETEFEIEHFMSIDVVRVYGKSDNEIFEDFDPGIKSATRKILRNAIPPFLLHLLKK
jgi:hypothetical protein